MHWVPPESFDEYRLVEALGRSNTGQVWLAHDTVLDRLVAVKLLVELPAHDDVRLRFLTEARAAARVQHPNIIGIYRVGEIGQRPYLISEYVRGDSLDKLARPVAWPRLLEIAIGLARGLAAAHRQGVLHCDLKPASAIVSETGEVKLRNFGFAQLLPQIVPLHAEVPSDREAAATNPVVPGDPTIAPQANSELFMQPLDEGVEAVEVAIGARQKPPCDGGALAEGTAPELPRPAIGPLPSVRCRVMVPTVYTPPEVWRDDPVTSRSDVYSLGALLYELGVRVPPHSGDSPDDARDIDPLPLASAAPGIDARFAAVVDRCLRRDPAERFASGDVVLEALEALAACGKTAASMRTRPLLDRRPTRRMAVVAALALAFALALLAYIRFYRKASPGSCPAGMVPVPAGTFRMGSPEGAGKPDEQPQREVTLSAYCIDQTEVTIAAYAACVAANECRAASRTVNWNGYVGENVKIYTRWCNGEDRPDHPINCVDWDQASAYCTWRGKRLPTEAEWEYAARGSDGRMNPWGKEAPNAKRLNACGTECTAITQWPAMYNGNDGWETTAPVGSYPEGRSPFGAFDMAGNVYEWTADWYGMYPKQAETNPQGPSTGTSRVCRGGGWCSIDASLNRAVGRAWHTPTVRDVDVGFRCVCGN